MTQPEKNELTAAVWLSTYENKQKLVLLRIAYFLRLPDGYADLGQSKLARYCNCSERHVRRLQTKLEADGVLVTQLVHEKTWHNRYALNLAMLMTRQTTGDAIESGGDQSRSGSPESDRSATPGPVKSARGGPVGSEEGVLSSALTKHSTVPYRTDADAYLHNSETKPAATPEPAPAPSKLAINIAKEWGETYGLPNGDPVDFEKFLRKQGVEPKHSENELWNDKAVTMWDEILGVIDRKSVV